MLTFIASPFRGERERNLAYARRALLASIRRGETPVVPHLLYPQVLDDDDPAQREQGIAIANTLLRQCSIFAAYYDYGVSPGMKAEYNLALAGDLMIEFRNIGQNQ